MRTLKKIKVVACLLCLIVLLGCATPHKKVDNLEAIRVFPWPDFKVIDIGDMLCAPDLENKVKFDRWLEDVDKWIAEVEAVKWKSPHTDRYWELLILKCWSLLRFVDYKTVDFAHDTVRKW